MGGCEVSRLCWAQCRLKRVKGSPKNCRSRAGGGWQACKNFSRQFGHSAAAFQNHGAACQPAWAVAHRALMPRVLAPGQAWALAQARRQEKARPPVRARPRARGRPLARGPQTARGRPLARGPQPARAPAAGAAGAFRGVAWGWAAAWAWARPAGRSGSSLCPWDRAPAPSCRPRAQTECPHPALPASRCQTAHKTKARKRRRARAKIDVGGQCWRGKKLQQSCVWRRVYAGGSAPRMQTTDRVGGAAWPPGCAAAWQGRGGEDAHCAQRFSCHKLRSHLLLYTQTHRVGAGLGCLHLPAATRQRGGSLSQEEGCTIDKAAQASAASRKRRNCPLQLRAVQPLQPSARPRRPPTGLCHPVLPASLGARRFPPHPNQSRSSPRGQPTPQTCARGRTA